MTIDSDIKELGCNGIDVAFDRIIPKEFRRFAPLIWAVLAVMPILAALLLREQLQNGREEFIFFSASLSVGIYNIPWAFRYCCNMLLSWTKLYPNFVLETEISAGEWFTDQLKFFRGSKIMLATGLGTTALAVIAYIWSGVFDGYSMIMKIFSFTLLSVSAFVAGMGICAVCLGTFAIYRFGQRFQVHVSDTKVGILSTGITLGKCYFAIAFVWSFYVLGSFTLEEPGSVYYLGVPPPVLLLALPTFILFLWAFFACQVPLRLRMQEFKRRKIDEVEEALRDIRPERYLDLSAQVIVQIEFLEKERIRFARLAEWPFSPRVFLGTLFSSIYLVWPLLVNGIFNVVFDETLKEMIVEGLKYSGFSS